MRFGVAVANEVGNPARDHAGLAGSGAGGDQQRTLIRRTASLVGVQRCPEIACRGFGEGPDVNGTQLNIVSSRAPPTTRL